MTRELTFAKILLKAKRKELWSESHASRQILADLTKWRQPAQRAAEAQGGFSVYMYIYIFIYTNTFMYIYIYIHVCVFVHVCIYTYQYTYVYIFIHTALGGVVTPPSS